MSSGYSRNAELVEIEDSFRMFPASVNMKDQNGDTRLHKAPDTKLVRLLIKYGADVNSRNAKGLTPLHKQVSSHEATALLLANGADPNARDMDGWTPLHYVRDSSTAALLITHGANVNTPNNCGDTPLFYSAGRAVDPKLVEFLVDAGADVNTRNSKGKTALHVAANRGHLETVQFLLSVGADVEATDEDGKLPLDYAEKKGYDAITEILRTPHSIPRRVPASQGLENAREVSEEIFAFLEEMVVFESTLNREIALEFLRKHQPLPPDEEMSLEVIAKYGEIYEFFNDHPDPACIPLLLNSFGDGSGFGVYQMIPNVLHQFPLEEVVTHLKSALSSPHQSVRHWCAEMAGEFPSSELIAPLTDLLTDKSNSDETRLYAVWALGSIDDKSVERILRQTLVLEKSDDVREAIIEALE